MTEFYQDVTQRKALARMSKYRKCGSKSTKCPMSTDRMTRKQWEERCGEVQTYVMNEPKTWAVFKALPTSIQKEYIQFLMNGYNVNASSLAQMFGVRPLTVRRHIEMNNLGISFKVGNSMNAAQKREWLDFLQISAGQEAAADVKQSETPFEEPETLAESCDTAPQSPSSMEMRQFSLTFQGTFDLDMIANSIRSIAGPNAVGKIEIICTL